VSELLTSSAHELFAHYLTAAAEYWGTGPGPDVQVGKIVRATAAIAEREGLSRDETIEYVLVAARRRGDGHPPTVHIGGRGGSGSHWLAEMLNDLGSFADCGEVAFPSPLRKRMRELALDQQSLLLDAIHLLHALPGSKNAAELSLVNSRGTVHYMAFKRWEPGCRFVHLIRDPREQCISVTYRKPDARELYPAGGGDEDFLRLMVYLNRASILRVLGSPVAPDLVVRYEDLRSEPVRALLGLARGLGIEVSSEAAERVAFQHRAENIQAGLAPSKGNLYSGPRRGWRETTSERERQILHAGLSDIVDITRYPLDDCLGRLPEPEGLSEEVLVELADGVLLGELHARSASAPEWEPLCGAAGTVRLPAGIEVRLRCPGGWTSGLAHLPALPAGALHSLCLAGNQDVLDGDLVHLASHPGLRELDLARTPITDQGLAHVEALQGLRGLNLLGSRVSDEGAREYAAAHPGCTIAAGNLWAGEWRAKGWLEDQFIP
jgi:hypothetical protein